MCRRHDTTSVQGTRAPDGRYVRWLSVTREHSLAVHRRIERLPEGARWVDARASEKIGSWLLPVYLAKPVHQPHLENFFDAIRNGTPLNCPAEVGYECAVTVLKVNEAVEAARKLEYKPEEFKVG